MVIASLQDQLDEITANTRHLVQEDRLAISERAVADLFSTGIEDRILPVGAQAPEFALKDATGKLLRTPDLLQLGPLIVKFFRGRWCSYCATELETWRDLYGQIRERGALLIAVSPQVERQNDFMANQHGLPFPVLSDADLALTRALRLPTMDVAGLTLLKRLAFIARDGTIERVFYPVFPPDRNAADVLAALR